MKTRLLLLLAAIGLSLVAVPPAQAATTYWAYSGMTGGTYVHLANGTVTSDLTANSSVSGNWTNDSAQNSTASAKVGSLGTVGAVTTKMTATYAKGKTTQHSYARTAGVNLLGGLIRADAVTTTMTSWAKTDGTHGRSGNTQFAGLHISGVHVPVTIPKNWFVTIPGVATVAANFIKSDARNGMVANLNQALNVTLLQPRDGMPSGAKIVINPENQYYSKSAPGNSVQLAGGAFAAQIKANVGSSVKVSSDPVAYIPTPFGSSHGTTLSNGTAGVNLMNGLTTLLRTGAARSTTTSNADRQGNAWIRNTDEIAGLNLLGGLIKADAIKVVARGKVQDGKWTGSLGMTTVNLVVAGHAIPINVAPNTTINVANLGKVEINRRVRHARHQMDGIDAIRITLSTSRAGLDAGSVIRIGAASTQII